MNGGKKKKIIQIQINYKENKMNWEKLLKDEMVHVYIGLFILIVLIVLKA